VPAAVLTRRRPGIVFEPQPPAPDEILPRMDIAAFVGFAASGPIDVPVVVEDAAQFAAIFGSDAQLVRDQRTGEAGTAHLGPTVRAFFRNGGRRCWIVRVAGPSARVTALPVPGLVRQRRDGMLEQAELRARSPGSWADTLRAGSAVISTPVEVVGGSLQRGELELALARPGEVTSGDVVRLTFPAGTTLQLAVRGAEPLGEAHPSRPATPRRTLVRVGFAEPVWLHRRPAPLAAAGRARFLGLDRRRHVVAATVSGAEGRSISVDVAAPSASAPPPGSLVRFRLPSSPPLWLVVRSAESVPGTRAGGAELLRVTGEALWHGPPDPLPELDSASFAERLTVELHVLRGAEERFRISDLGLGPGHSRYLGDLPHDAELYERLAEASGEAPPPLWRAAAEPRFPLAAAPGRCRAEARPFFAIALGSVPELFLSAVRRREEPEPLVRDGLEALDAGIFLDRTLRHAGARTLLEQADFIRYQSERPRALTGIHALLAVEEVTLAAVPDALHRPWERDQADPLPPVTPGPAPTPPAADPGRFGACAAWRPPPALAATEPDASGSFTLLWSEPAGARLHVVEESAAADFASATVVYRGRSRQVELFGRPLGTRHYRVRTEEAGVAGRPSNTVAVRVSPPAGWLRRGAEAYADAMLTEVHLALVRMCGARGDLLALLSLPEHYDGERALAHLAALRAFGEDDVPLGYASLHHPWPVGRDETPGDVHSSPPDGAVAGVLAQRARARGAWVAPANEALRDVLTLVPSLPPGAADALDDVGVTALRHTPAGFAWLASQTLSEDADLRPLNVRRLLILLRRLALKHGAAYVFEPMGPELERRIQRGFESLLTLLHGLGALEGRTSSEAFRVDVGAGPEPRPSPDDSRLLVELKVAPSRPLRFLTVRLVNAGERGLRVESR
jgi:hypothetical protein